MKKIQKSIMMLAALLMAGATMTSCSSDEEKNANDQPEQGKYFMKINASKSNEATRALGWNDETESYDGYWKTTDVITVMDAVSHEVLGSLSPESRGVQAVLSGTITKPAESGQYFLLARAGDATDIPGFDYTGQNGEPGDNIDKYDYSMIPSLSATTEGNAIVAVNDSYEFDNCQSIVVFNLKNESGLDLKTNQLTIDCVQENSSGVEKSVLTQTVNYTSGATSYGPLVINTSSSTTYDSQFIVALRVINNPVKVILTAKAGDKTYICTRENVTFTNGKFYGVTAKLVEATPDGGVRKTYGSITSYDWTE